MSEISAVILVEEGWLAVERVRRTPVERIGKIEAEVQRALEKRGDGYDFVIVSLSQTERQALVSIHLCTSTLRTPQAGDGLTPRKDAPQCSA